MALRAARPCGAPGCANFAADTARCVSHERAARAQLDAQRPTRSERGYDTRWEKARKGFLAKHGACARCPERATVVDHIVPHRGDWDLFWVRGDYERRPAEPGWMPLCASCHSRKTAQQDGRWGSHALRPPGMGRAIVPLTVVCAPAGAGAREYVHAQAKPPGSLVLDLDELKAELSGLPLHQAPHEVWGRPAMRERNARLLRLCDAPVPWPAAWLITGAPQASDRRWWRDVAGARILVLQPELERCLERIRADARPDPAGRMEAARRWFEEHTVDPFGDEVISAAATW